MQVNVHVVNAFVENGTGGNPAGVVLRADDINNATRLAIARKVNLSETAFVSTSGAASLRMEFFTPTKQIPHCGHATIAAFSLCKQLDLLPDGLHTKESIDGTLPVELDGDMTFMYQRQPLCTAIEPSSELGALALAAIGASEQDLIPYMAPCIARSGNAFLLFPFRAEDVLASLVPNHAAIERVSTALDLVGFYPFAVSGEWPMRSAGTRMFAPRYGIHEESATGTAAGPLAYFLTEVLGMRNLTHAIEQGRYMSPPSRSLIRASLVADPAGAPSIKVGGSARKMGCLRIDV